MCLALGKQRTLSKELAELLQLAAALYEDHPRLENANEARKSATTERDEKLEPLTDRIDQLQGASARLFAAIHFLLNMLPQRLIMKL